MSLFDISNELCRRKTAAEESMCRGFCRAFAIDPRKCMLEMRETQDGITEYWLSFPGGEPLLMGRAFPLEFTRDGDDFKVNQRFEVRHIGHNLRVTL